MIMLIEQICYSLKLNTDASWTDSQFPLSACPYAWMIKVRRQTKLRTDPGNLNFILTFYKYLFIV